MGGSEPRRICHRGLPRVAVGGSGDGAPSPAPRGPPELRGSRAGLGAGAALTAAPGGQDRGQQQQQDERQPHAGAGQGGDTGGGTARTAGSGRMSRARSGTAREGVVRGRFRTPEPSQHKRGRTLAKAQPRGAGAAPASPGHPARGSLARDAAARVNTRGHSPKINRGETGPNPAPLETRIPMLASSYDLIEKTEIDQPHIGAEEQAGRWHEPPKKNP